MVAAKGLCSLHYSRAYRERLRERSKKPKRKPKNKVRSTKDHVQNGYRYMVVDSRRSSVMKIPPRIERALLILLGKQS